MRLCSSLQRNSPRKRIIRQCRHYGIAERPSDQALAHTPMPRIDDRGRNVGSGFATTDLVEHGAAFCARMRSKAFGGFAATLLQPASADGQSVLPAVTPRAA